MVKARLNDCLCSSDVSTKTPMDPKSKLEVKMFSPQLNFYNRKLAYLIYQKAKSPNTAVIGN